MTKVQPEGNLGRRLRERFLIRGNHGRLGTSVAGIRQREDQQQTAKENWAIHGVHLLHFLGEANGELGRQVPQWTGHRLLVYLFSIR